MPFLNLDIQNVMYFPIWNYNYANNSMERNVSSEPNRYSSLVSSIVNSDVSQACTQQHTIQNQVCIVHVTTPMP
jgi:hypothetical protein